MSWEKIPTSTIFNLKKLKKKNVILSIPTLPCCCIPRQVEGFGQILYGYKFTQQTYDLGVAGYLGTDVSVGRIIPKFMDVLTLGDGTDKLS